MIFPTRRIVVAHPLPLAAEALARALHEEPDICVVGRAGTAAAALALVRREHPDVAVVHQEFPDAAGTWLAHAILEASPSTHVLLMTTGTTRASAGDALAAGCRGIISKYATFADLVHAVHTVGATAVLPAELVTELLWHPEAPAHAEGPYRLSRREREVLVLLAEGVPVRGMAERLGVRVTTLRNHVQRLLHKLDVHSQREAVGKALREGLIPAPAATGTARSLVA